MSNLNDIITKVQKKHKTTLITEGLGYEEIKRIDFSSPRANWSLRGGIPRNRMTEFAGENASGKTTAALDIVANAQKAFSSENNQKVLFVDVENTLDHAWSQKLGVDTKSMVYFRPTIQSAEEVLQITLDLADTGEFGLIVLDSIGALVTEARLKKTLDEKTFCGVAGPFTDFVNMLQKLISKHNITFLGINQVKPVIGSLYPQLSYKGGEAWKYQCSVRLLFSKGKLFDSNDNEVNNSFDTPNGHKINVKVNKTKICPADRLLTFFTLNYNDGIDVIGDTIDVAVTLGIIERRGSWFFLPDDKKFQGRNGVKSYFLEDLDHFKEFYSTILGLMTE